MVSNNHSNNEHGQYLPYMKLWPEEWLTSSIHYNCTLEEQGFFVALMALAAKNRKERGCLSLEAGQPMPLSVIANALYVDIKLCELLINKMIEQDRVGTRQDGVLFIKNFEYYQNMYRRGKKNKQGTPEQIEEKEKQYLHHLQGKYPEEIKKETKPVYVNEQTGEIINKGD